MANKTPNFLLSLLIYVAKKSDAEGCGCSLRCRRRGDDNAMQLVWGVWPLVSYMKQKGIEGYVIAPQCPAGKQWVDTPWGLSPPRLRSRHELWGHLLESAVGARLIPGCRRNNIQLRYWNAGNKEVDFVLRKGDRLVAMEVKSADADSVSGMKEFKARYARAKPYLIGGQGMSSEMFFSYEVDGFL